MSNETIERFGRCPFCQGPTEITTDGRPDNVAADCDQKCAQCGLWSKAPERMSNETIERASIAVVIATIIAGMLCGCSTINVYPPLGCRDLTITINQSVPKTMTGSLPLGDSAIKSAAEGATGIKPQNVTGALDALKGLQP